MKNSIKLLLILLVFSMTGCTKGWLDINDDPNSPSTPELNQLLSGSQRYMTYALGQGNFIGNNLSSYVHHLVAREVQNYGMTGTANNPYNSWNYFYNYVVNNYDAIIKSGEADGNLIYAGIAKTLKAYTFSMMVDLWGDIPYSEYNVVEILAPKADGSASIYNALIATLESGIADLQNTTALNVAKPAGDDFFYAGNTAKWIRLNNTIQLKLLLQSRKAKGDITGWQSKFDALIAANNFIASGEDFQFWYTAKASPDERHPAFTSEYGTGTTYWISPYFYEMMKGLTHNNVNNPFAGISDPRVPYYFYNQLATGGAAQNNYDYREGNFLTIFFASNSGNSAGTQNNSMTKPGVYPCGGKYDTGAGGRYNAAPLGTGVAPLKFITYHSLKFMLAELALEGETGGDARTLLKDGLDASIAHVNSVAARQTGVPAISNVDRDAFTTAVLAKYDATATTEAKLEMVMSQKWIGNFFTPVDAYTDYRRTGYPSLFNPANTTDPGYGVNPTATAGSPARVPINTIATFPRSLYYPTTSETDLNPNLNQKTDLTGKFIFWDK